MQAEWRSLRGGRTPGVPRCAAECLEASAPVEIVHWHWCQPPAGPGGGQRAAGTTCPCDAPWSPPQPGLRASKRPMKHVRSKDGPPWRARAAQAPSQHGRQRCAAAAPQWPQVVAPAGPGAAALAAQQPAAPPSLKDAAARIEQSFKVSWRHAERRRPASRRRLAGMHWHCVATAQPKKPVLKPALFAAGPLQGPALPAGGL